MHADRTFLQDLALVLCVAAVTTVLFRRLRQPVVLGYLLAGVIVGPHLPVPLFVDEERVHALSELGVILVMFSVGLEFSIGKLVRVVPTSGIIGIIQLSTMLWLGYVAGRAFGWSAQESIFTGAMVAISSTMVVTKIFAEQRVAPSLSETVLGVLVVQDLAAILLLAVLTAISSGKGLPAAVLMRTAGELVAFLLGIVVLGFLVVPRAIRAVARLKSPETLLIASIGACFALALIAQEVGYSVALGAFLAGTLVAESGEADRVEHLIRPVRDIFAAIFFVAVGMILDPSVLAEHWPAALVLVLVVIVGQIASVTLGALLSGRDLKTAIQAGMSLAQIGEFSFIIAGVGVEHGAIGRFLYPVAVAVSVLTTFTTPWLIRGSDRVAMLVDRKLPHRVQTFMSLYDAWLEQLRTQRAQGSTPGAQIGRLVRLLALDMVCLAAIVIGTAVGTRQVLEFLSGRLGVPAEPGRWLVVGSALLLAVPFLIGIVRIARTLGQKLAEAALPASPSGKVELEAGPRRALVIAFQLAVMLLVGIPLLALTQPFVSPPYGLILLVVVLAVFGIGFWRSTAHLEEQAQAGAQMILEALAKQGARARPPHRDEAASLVPGLGPLTPVRLAAGSPAVGQTLTQINLRALSGASVIAIMRGMEGLKPTGREELKEGDVLALAGTQEAIRAATAMLVERGGTAPRLATPLK